MAHQSQNQLPSDQPLELQKPHISEDDLIEQESPLLSSCRHHDSDHRDETQNHSSASKSIDEEIALQELEAVPMDVTKDSVESEVLGLAEDSGRERLKRHRLEVAGRVWIPDIWGQEELLKDWIDCSAFDAPLVPSRMMSARAALVDEARRATTGGLRIENRNSDFNVHMALSSYNNCTDVGSSQHSHSLRFSDAMQEEHRNN